MITIYASNPHMLKQYIKINAIKSAFVYKTDNREYTVYYGDASTLQGWEHKKFRTLKEAKIECTKINDLIKSVL